MVSVKSAEVYTRVPVSDREANLAVDYAVNAYNRKSDNPYLFKQRYLNSAKYKITSPGVKSYTVIFDIKETFCQEQVELRVCPFKSDSDAAVGVCEAEVFFEFGFQIKVPETPSCNLRRPVKRVGEILNRDFIFLSEKQKVVIRERYWVHFQIQETVCQEDKHELSPECPLKAKDEAVLGNCYADVLFPIGETKGQLRGLPKCQLFQLIVDKDVDGLSCVGCFLPLRTNDPRVHRTMEHAISKFNDNSGQRYKFALARVLTAEHETSADEVITLNFTLIETTCLNNNDTAPDMCGPKIPATAGSAVCLTKQHYDIFGELLYHRLRCNVTQDWIVYANDVTEVFGNGTDSLGLQSEKPVTPEPTMKSRVDPTIEHITEPPAEPQNPEEPMSLVNEAKPIASTGISKSDLSDE
ncbi:hypothetical protein scyTo_0002003 [Scyliorhinus torazame]|uniref:Cystatin domain-containing protein n=1 Tax=Scyliorhinus torazame TaxID=75743 RepID=A0A401PH50_SCYTO|nr:hypothetical protein [Scyliorhinus torazame]